MNFNGIVGDITLSDTRASTLDYSPQHVDYRTPSYDYVGIGINRDYDFKYINMRYSQSSNIIKYPIEVARIRIRDDMRRIERCPVHILDVEGYSLDNKIILPIVNELYVHAVLGEIDNILNMKLRHIYLYRPSFRILSVIQETSISSLEFHGNIRMSYIANLNLINLTLDFDKDDVIGDDLKYIPKTVRYLNIYGISRISHASIVQLSSLPLIKLKIPYPKIFSENGGTILDNLPWRTLKYLEVSSVGNNIHRHAVLYEVLQVYKGFYPHIHIYMYVLHTRRRYTVYSDYVPDALRLLGGVLPNHVDALLRLEDRVL